MKEAICKSVDGKENRIVRKIKDNSMGGQSM